MSTTPLVLASSIPPSLRGKSFDPFADGSLQLRTVESWRRAGFVPLSLHTAAELAVVPGHAACLAQAGVAVLEVPQADPEPLPNLLAALEALLAAHPSSLLALTNADILFAPGRPLPNALHKLGLHQALISRRTNVASDSEATSPHRGSRDLYGFDFFCFHANALRRALPLIPEGLVFGRPWWDLFLPLALLAAGLELLDPGDNLFLHPHHEERWSSEQWLRYGQQADQRFLQLLHQQGCLVFAQSWQRQRHRAISRWPGATVLRHRLREQCRGLLRQGRLLPLYLSDVSDAINTLVDSELQAPPRS